MGKETLLIECSDERRKLLMDVIFCGNFVGTGQLERLWLIKVKVAQNIHKHGFVFLLLSLKFSWMSIKNLNPVHSMFVQNIYTLQRKFQQTSAI